MGNPEAPFPLESKPSGRYLNLGAYGNTPVASQTLMTGSILISF
jgi:hypothetical protein